MRKADALPLTPEERSQLSSRKKLICKYFKKQRMGSPFNRS